MEVQEKLLFNYASIVATILAATTAGIIIINKLRLRWPVQANCWFCNTNGKIPRSEVDWWQCSSCQQYNGFSEDGDYNYDIPEQRDRSLNDLTGYSASCRPEKSHVHSKNTLCRSCNCNEEMKLCQMRLLDPMILSKKKIESCRQSLEKQYPLCSNCNSLVKSVLQKQSTWLTQYKMLLFKQRPINIIVNNSEKLEKLYRIILTILSSIIIGYPTLQALPIFGALLQLFTATRKLNSKNTYHLLLILIWLGVCTLMPFCGEQLVRFKLRTQWYTLEYITGYQVITLLSTILGFTNATLGSSTTSSPNLSFKKMDNSNTDLNISHNSTDELNDYLDRDEVETRTSRKSPVNITHLLTSPSPLETPAPIKPMLTFPNFKICNSQLSFASLDSHQDTFDTLWKHSARVHPEKACLNDSLRTLSSLSLSGRDEKSTLKNSRVFETRTYGTTSPDLFKRNFQTTKKFVLSPPKFKSVTQNSWVAGGYWQMGMDTPTLSRSSSQSSGFGSTGSNFAPSREPSVVNDVDRYSVMSDTTLCCNYQPQSNITPMNSFCQYTSSPCRGMGQEVPMCMNPSSSILSNTACSQISQRTLCHSHHINDQYMKNSPVMVQQAEVPICINHPTTVFNSQVWVPVLVCGSLFLNIIVFCTVLLR